MNRSSKSESDTPEQLYRILIVGGLGSSKTKVLLNLVKHQRPDIEKLELYVNSNRIINCLSREENKERIKQKKNLKIFIDYSQTIDEVYENVEDYHNPTKKK